MDYLIEIGTEELPAGTTAQIAKQFSQLFVSTLDEYGLCQDSLYPDLELFSTPRRLALLLKNLPAQTQAGSEILKGPGIQAPEQAIESFISKNQLDKKNLYQENGRYFCKKVKDPQPIEQVLKKCLDNACDNLTGEKWMTWAGGEFNFSRPVRWIVSLLDKEVLPLEKFGLKSGRQTRVNRLLEAENKNAKFGFKFVEIKSAADYTQVLRENLVEASPLKRKESIQKQIAELEKKHNVIAEIPEDLITEVVDLLEWPQALVGEFEAKFLEIPSFLTVTVLEKHQRYFPCFKDSQKAELSNKFIFIANCLPEAQTNVVQGNQRVLAARLNDAEFFVQEDLKRVFADNQEKLKNLTFLKELDKEVSEGQSSYYAKVQRLVKAAELLASKLKLADKSSLVLAAQLSKNDLVSSIVYEFPELQGLAGGFIAGKQKIASQTAQAISEHYLPQSSENPQLPKTALGLLLSIMDKADNIIAAFLAGKIPTGSADPFALRRQLQAIVIVLLEAKHYNADELSDLSLEEILKISFNSFWSTPKMSFEEFFYSVDKSKKINLAEFAQQRIGFIFSQNLDSAGEVPQLDKNLVDAFIGSSCCLQTSLPKLKLTLQKLQSIQNSDSQNKAKADMLKALSNFRRISRILKDSLGEVVELLPQKHYDANEKPLLEVIDKLSTIPADDFDLEFCIKPIDQFFENVMVNDPNDLPASTRRKNLLLNLKNNLDAKFFYADWDKLVAAFEV